MPVTTAQAIDSAATDGRAAREEMKVLAAAIAATIAAPKFNETKLAEQTKALAAASKRYVKARTRYHAYHTTRAA